MTKETQKQKELLRAEKRAAALRDNLRRRKTAAQSNKDNDSNKTPDKETP